MKTQKCTMCNDTGCVTCPKCEGEDFGEYKTCSMCTPSTFNVNDCGQGKVKCSKCKDK